MTQATVWPEGHDRVILQETDSTLDEAQRRFAQGVSRPTWILALNQTAARGRRGRAWAMPAGNFATTLILPTGDPTDRIALRSFTTSLALFDACVAATGRVEGLALKWPNDVLLNGGKLAGSLEPRAVPPVALASVTGALVAPEEFLTFLAAAFARYETQFATYGFEPIRRAWLDRAAHLGNDITARTGTSETRGRFETIDATGQLILTTDAGRQAIAAADIYF